MKTRVWWTALIAVAVATTSCTSGGDRVTFPTAAAPLLTNTSLPASTASPRSAPATTAPAPIAPATKTIATGLPLPWGLAFLPDGTALVTLRDQGEVLHIADGAKPVSVGRPPGVVPGGEGGLLGIAISPILCVGPDRVRLPHLAQRQPGDADDVRRHRSDAGRCHRQGHRQGRQPRRRPVGVRP